MTGGEVLVHLKNHGVILEPSGDNLHYRAPKGVLTSELREALVEHKSEVLALLQQGRDYAATACICPEPIGGTGPDRCGVCELPLLCPKCERCRGCKLRLRFPR